MSEAKTENKDRKPYRLDIENDAFNPDYDGKYLTSIEFCKLTNEIFRAAFVNFYGSKFEISGGQPVMSLLFTHMDQVPEYTEDQDGNSVVAHVATTRADGNKVGNKTIDSIRRRENFRLNGDKFYLTEDGKDIIKPLLFPRIYNNGKVNWNSIVVETSDANGSSLFGTMNQIQLTKVGGIDPKRVASLIWGRKDEDGEIDYGISIMRDLTINSGFGMPGSQGGKNYAMSITRAHVSAISKTYENLGLGSVGSNIIR